jgi:membrane protein
MIRSYYTLMLWDKIYNFFNKDIWHIDVSSIGRFKALIVKFLRLSYIIAREFYEGQISLTAASLVYTTLLSLVPLLAVSFSLLKAFGVHNQIAPYLSNFLAALGPNADEITQGLLGFVSKMKVGVLGSAGLILLIYTSVSLISKIEVAFNDIWTTKKHRGIISRFSNYLSILLIGPVLIFSALGITASISSATLVQKLLLLEPFGTTLYFIGKVLPYLFVCTAFTLMYLFLPSAKVKFKSALTGGFFAGILWETASWVFASFIVASSKYPAIYSGFAILIFFMIWMFITWIIVLIGAKISFYHQYPQSIVLQKEQILTGSRYREKLSLAIMFLIGYNFYHNRPPWDLDTLTGWLRVPLKTGRDVLAVLIRKGLIIETGNEPPSYLPAKDIETISLEEIIRSMRTAQEEVGTTIIPTALNEEAEKIINIVDNCIADALKTRNLKDLVVSAKHFFQTD